MIRLESQSNKQKVNTSDLFRLIPKTRGSKNNVAVNPNSFQCEFTECNKTGVDTIKGNICSRWIMQSCHDVPASKLKPIFKKCKTSCAVLAIISSMVRTLPVLAQSSNLRT